MDLMTLPVGHHLSKLPFQSLLVNVLLIVHQLGIHPLFAVQCDHLLVIEMVKMIIHEDLPATVAARVVICLIEIIQTMTESGNGTGTGIEKRTGIGIGIGIGIEGETETEAEIELGSEKGTGTETETGTGREKGTEIGGMIMKEGPEKAAEGIMIRAAVIVEAEAGAGAGVKATKLIVHIPIIIQVHIEMATRKRLLHLAIWPSLETCTAT